MESTGCYLALGLMLGVLISALLLEGNARRKAAMSKIRALEKERAKAEGIMKQAHENRRKGCRALPGAYLLILLGVALLILAAYLLATGPGF